MNVYLLLSVMLLLVACGAGGSEEQEDTVGKEIADGYNKSMDKARQVEDLGFEQKARMDAALEEADRDAGKDP
jgi:hypothetical protein